MNSIIMNFDDSVDINAEYSKLKKLYPKVEITKKSKKNAAQELKEVMELEFKKLNISSEEEFITWVEDAREELWRESHT